MSHVRVKTIYKDEDGMGGEETKTLYAHHNLSCDRVIFYDEDGDFLFSLGDTVDNNMYDAIVRLYSPRTNKGQDLIDHVEYMNAEDKEKCKL